MMEPPPPPAKKLRVMLSKPGIKSGVVSASRSASYADPEDPLNIEVALEKDKGYFFPESFDFSKESAAISSINCPLSKWIHEKYSEDAVRDDIYNALLDPRLGLHFPKNSRGGSTAGVVRYSESELKTIFRQHAKDKGLHDGMKPTRNGCIVVQEKEQGLLVKLTSKPDLCIIRGGEIVVGEIKQKPSYTIANGIRQCAVYCYAVLYYYRVILGIPMDRVYGFWLCGPTCSDLKPGQNYAVGIMELVAPQSLGDIFRGKQYVEKFHNSSLDGIKLLVNFLTQGRTASIVKTSQIPVGDRGPFRFALPNGLWGQDDNNDIVLVRGGTCAVVVKLKKTLLRGFLGEHVEASVVCEEEFQEFLENVDEFLKREDDRDRSMQSGYVFLKVRTSDTSVRFAGGFKDIWSKIKKAHARQTISDDQRNAFGEFLDTYLIEPFEDNDFSLCVMADRGKPFEEHLNGNFQERHAHIQNLKEMLDHLKFVTKHLCKYIIHGDILLHNVVNRGRNLYLVDYDEGVAATKHVSRRNLDLDQNNNAWLQAMFYPNVLRQFGERYTQVQLLALMFLSLYNDRPIEGLGLTFFAELQTLGNRLLENDNEMHSKGWIAGKRKSEESIPLDVILLIDTLWGMLPLNDTEIANNASL